MTRKPNYDAYPYVDVHHHANACRTGWEAVIDEIRGRALSDSDCPLVAIEAYPGVFEEEIASAVERRWPDAHLVRSQDAIKPEEEVDALTAPFTGGDDPIFGWIAALKLIDFFDIEKVRTAAAGAAKRTKPTVVIGVGATLITGGAHDVLIYADMPRWELQLRMRADRVANLGTANRSLKWSLQYKRAYFVDWRVCDRHKKALIGSLDYLLDTTIAGTPKLVTGEAFRAGLRQSARRPFRVVPFFDPAPWGGRWMEEVCGLEPASSNYGWCFDCVPEENSLNLRFGETVVEIPSIDLVFDQPVALLGDRVHARFGDEFPIRFDFLDTIGGGNLSFQVHPLTEFIQNEFGMHYTQDESYYILDADEDATVYLGLKEDVDPDAMVADLVAAQRGEKRFDDERFVNRLPAKKHDHFLIPAGTVHCSGAGSMVLEISATPYIFTFKLWDWGRVGLDGLPRPINIERGVPNIQWDRATAWVEKNLINRVTEVASGDGWREERTGLHEREFIETRRHWFTARVPHHTHGGVNVLNLVQGEEAIVESPTGSFEPFMVHYAETFIVPAAVGAYTIRPYGAAVGTECATMKAFVRAGGVDDER